MRQINQLIQRQRIDLISKGYTGSEQLLQQLSSLVNNWDQLGRTTPAKNGQVTNDTFYATLTSSLKAGRLPIEWSFHYEYKRHPPALTLVDIQASLFDVS